MIQMEDGLWVPLKYHVDRTMVNTYALKKGISVQN
jgi:hypothetical protein